MSNVTVGTLIVDLQANTASFVSGLDKAGQISLTSTKNIQKAFEAMGAGLATVFTAVEAGLAEMVDKSIENSARLYDMAQSAGVSTAALSGLEFAAKQSGVSVEAMDSGLEKLAKSMLSTAQGTGTGVAAFKQLGISVTDANGQLRPTQDVLADLAQKFSTMPDGPNKTALAMQLFGRAGAQLVPLLNQGKAGIDDLMMEAQKLGVVIDTDTAAAAKKFQESMDKLTAAATGFGNKLAAEVLPQMQLVIDNIIASSEETNSRISGLLAVAGVAGKAFVVAFGAVQTFFDSLGNLIMHMGADVVTLFNGLGAAAKDSLHGNFTAAVNDVKDINAAMTANAQLSANDQAKIWHDYADGVVTFWNATVQKVAAKPITTTSGPAPVSKAQEKFTETIALTIAKLKDAADAEALLAAAQKGSTAATIEDTAATEAGKIIKDLDAQATEKKLKGLTDVQKAQILAIETEKAFATVANELSKQLADEVTKTQEQTAGVIAMAAAFAQGGAAIATAQEAAKLEPFRVKVQALQTAFDNLTASQKTSSAGLLMAKDLAQATSQLDAATVALHAFMIASEQAASAEENTKLDRQIDATKGYTQAVMDGAAALRQFNIDQQVLAYTRNPAFDQSTEAVEKYRAELNTLSAAELQKSTAEKVAAVANLGNIQDEINQLILYRQTVTLNGQQELAVDALIHDAELKKQKDMDDLLLKTNSVQAGMKVFFDQFLNDGVTTATKVNDIMKTTMTDLSNTIADGLAKGKLSFQTFTQDIESMLLKLVLNQLFKSLFGFLNNSSFFGGLGGGTIFGSGGIFGGAKAGGGPVAAGSIYSVGEQGQEWFVPQTAGAIVPNTRMGMTGAAPNVKPMVINQNITVNTPDLNSFKASQDQVAAVSYQAISRAARRNG